MGRKRTDISGQKFGHWTVLQWSDDNQKWIARCDCGHIGFFGFAATLRKSAGCKACAGSSQFKELQQRLIGTKVGTWTIFDAFTDKNRTRFIVQCDCGHRRKAYFTEINKHGCQKCGNYRPNTAAKHKSKALNRVGLVINGRKILRLVDVHKQSYRYAVQCMVCKKRQVLSYRNFRNTHCFDCAHPKGSQVSFAKLTEIDVLAIRELFASKMYTRQELSDMMKVSRSVISRIIARTLWKHI